MTPFHFELNNLIRLRIERVEKLSKSKYFVLNYLREYCHHCQNKLERKQVVFSKGNRNTKYYCISCAKRMFLTKKDFEKLVKQFEIVLVNRGFKVPKKYMKELEN